MYKNHKLSSDLKVCINSSVKRLCTAQLCNIQRKPANNMLEEMPNFHLSILAGEMAMLNFKQCVCGMEIIKSLNLFPLQHN